MRNANDIVKEGKKTAGTLMKHNKEFMNNFHGAAVAALGDGLIPEKHKEAFAVAIAMVLGCKGCIAAHAENALKAGASPEEIREACVAAMVFGGSVAMSRMAWVEQAMEDLRHCQQDQGSDGSDSDDSEE